MEFKLNEYHKDITDEELLEDLKRVAELLGLESLSQSDYGKHGKYSASTIERRFGGWNQAVKRVGLVARKVGEKKHESLKDDESFFEDLRCVAAKLGKDSITTGDYVRYGKFNGDGILRRYGSWNLILQKAGLKSTPYRLGKGKEISDEELFQDIERVWIKLGRQPTITDVRNGEFCFGQNTFARHFGGWRSALEAFIRYINSDDNEAPSLSHQYEPPTKVETNVKTNEQLDFVEQKGKEDTRPKSHKTSRDINLRLRFKVMARDNFKCCKCGRSPATDPTVILHVDHKYPWVKGGETTMENLETKCMECNLGKGDLVFEE